MERYTQGGSVEIVRYDEAVSIRIKVKEHGWVEIQLKVEDARRLFKDVHEALDNT